jgi:hypothetical protein
VRPCLDLDKRSEWETNHGKSASRRPVVAECSDVGVVHRGKVCHIGKENSRLHDVKKPAPLTFQQGGKVSDGLSQLSGEPTRDDRAIREAELARADQPLPGADNW